MPANDLKGLKKSLGYSFADEGLLVLALTHKSYYHENPRNKRPEGHNERLEFLGDSVLGLSVVESLYGTCLWCTEAEMSKIKSYIVKGEVLAQVARDLGLGEYILMGKGEDETGGRTKASILANAFEAVVGAIFVDGGYHTARDFLLSALGSRLSEALSTGELSDYKSELQELCQERFGSLPEYRLTGQEGLEHDKTFTVEVYVQSRLEGRGRGSTKKGAQTAAAREALEVLGAQ